MTAYLRQYYSAVQRTFRTRLLCMRSAIGAGLKKAKPQLKADAMPSVFIFSRPTKPRSTVVLIAREENRLHETYYRPIVYLGIGLALRHGLRRQ